MYFFFLKKEIVENIDFVVVCELIGGFYFGELKYWDNEVVVDLLIYICVEIEWIIEKVFEIVVIRNKKVILVDKVNVFVFSKLWWKIVDEVVSCYLDIILEYLYVDVVVMFMI